MTTTTPTMEGLGELLHHYYGETLAAEGDRDPAAPMASLPLKLPTATLEALQDRAAALHCNRGALARALVIRGLDELAATDAQGVAL